MRHLLRALPLGIVLVVPLRAQPWGWWDDDDSLARPVALDDSLDGGEGRVRLSTRTGRGGVRSVQAYDASVREGAWQVSAAGRDDSGPAPVRQRVTWTPGDLRVAVGDLPPWTDAPLLEGGTRRSGTSHVLGRLGSGRAPAGVEAVARTEEVAPFPVAIRTRTVAGSRSGARTSLLAEAGALRLGAAKASGEAPLPVGGLAWNTGNARLRTDLAGRPDRIAAAADLELRHARFEQTLSLSRVDRGFRHEGLESDAPGSTHAQATARWDGSLVAVGLQGRIARDSANLQRWTLLGQGSARVGAVRLRLRTRRTRSPTSASDRVTPGAEWTTGPFRSWTEASWTGGTGMEPAFGCSWRGRELHLDGSSIRRVDGGWDWKVASSLGWERSSRGTRVELECGRTGDVPRGGGSWIVRW